MPAASRECVDQVKDLNSILASWKGPLPYPNNDAATDLAASQRARMEKQVRGGKGEGVVTRVRAL
jgi:hypothetical protein